MNKVLNIKILGLLFFGILIIFALIRFNNNRMIYFSNSNSIQLQLDKIGHKELNLNYIVLESTIFLYNNNDNIKNAINDLNSAVNTLLKNSYFQNNFPNMYKKLQNKYKKEMNQKIEIIYEFNTINSAIKNSNTYLLHAMTLFPKLHKKYNAKLPEMYLNNFIDSVSNIFLSKNSLKNFINLENISLLEKKKFEYPEIQKLNKTIIAHLKMIYRNFPTYKQFLTKITNSPSQTTLMEINREFFNKNLLRVNKINYVFYGVVFFIVLYTLLIIYLFISINRENKKLKQATRTDFLTNLGNRHSYEEEVKLKDDCFLFLVNIDKFKQINEYFGTDIGDKVLIEVSKILTLLTHKYSSKLFRLGADDFGIMIENGLVSDYEEISNLIIQWFENNEIIIDAIHLKISICIGISNSMPYFEKADVALREAKKSLRLKYLFYTNDLDRTNEIKQNIDKRQVLYKAIKNNNIVPYFQPIVDTQTGKIIKYEVLARVISENRAESIYPYLQIAKDNKLYFNITKSILIKSVELFCGKKIDFNINFSTEDILDKNIIAMLDDIDAKYSGIFKRMTFEILESEAINDYDAIKNFITFVKAKGAKIAIDDFGSGYSNFEHLLNLQIDYIKIDGSLIKHIDKDLNSKKIVALISKFAKDSGIQVVAEFVENESIWNVLKELNIEYAQGYYFYKPESTFI